MQMADRSGGAAATPAEAAAAAAATAASWRSHAAVSDPRRATNRRRRDALQIRKRRREERLRRKRGLLPPTAAATTANTAAANNANATASLEAALSQYLNSNQPRDRDPSARAQLQLALSSNNRNGITTTFGAGVSSSSISLTTSSTSFLQRLLEEDEPRARQLVRFMRDDIILQQQQQQQYAPDSASTMLLSALSLLLELTCAVKSDRSAAAAAASYYGRPPLQWADLLAPSAEDEVANAATTTTNEPSLIFILLQMLTAIQQQPSQQPQSAMNNTNTTSTIEIAETICNILGNLVDDASQNCLPQLLPHWSSLLFWSNIWPASSYCCAALVRNDHTHYGMHFLQPPPQRLNSNLDQQLAPLFVLPQQSTTTTNNIETVSTKPTEAAWILEGLSRREDQAVHALMNAAASAAANNNGKNKNNPAWLANLIHTMDALNPASSSTADFFVPALRAVGNLCTACQGQYVPVFLEQQPALVETLSRLLDLSSSTAPSSSTTLSTVVLVDAIQTAAALLADAGLPGHPSTDLALPPLLPRLVALLLRSPRAPVRREAVFAIRNAVIALPGPEENENDDWVHDSHNDNETLRRMETESHLLAQLRYFVWTSSSNSSNDNSNNNEEEDQLHQEQLMQALVDLLRGATTHNDTEGVVPALQILDKLLRNIEASRFLFDSHGGVDLLQDICASCPNEMGLESQLAAHLVDDLFDEDDSVEYDDEAALAPQDGGDTFIFGVPAAAAAASAPMMAFDSTQHQQEPTNFHNQQQQHQQHLPPGGRGRGRTLPAWMDQFPSK